MASAFSEFPVAFTQIDGVRELPGGSVLVLDSRESQLRLLDIDAGTIKQVGRTGSGPTEYRDPVRLLPFSANRTALWDAGNARLLLIGPRGEVGTVVPLIQPGRIANSASGNRIIMPHGSDTLERVYHAVGGVLLDANGMTVVHDSSVITRVDLRNGRNDSVAYVRNPAAGFQPARGGATRPRSVVPAFEGTDEWIVAPDGRVAVVSNDPYRVTYFESGRRVDGPVVDYQPVPVTEADRRQWLAELAAPRQTIVKSRGSKTSARVMTRLPNRGRIEWPAHFPPFLHDALLFAPDGRLWIRRATSVDRPQLYDVVGSDGRLVERVTLPKQSRIVAFGAHAIYVVRVDEDGLQYLRRYAA